MGNKAKGEAQMMDPCYAEADALLREIGDLEGTIDALEEKFQEETEELRRQYRNFLLPAEERLFERHKALLKLMRSRKKVFFEVVDKVGLAHGWLVHGEEQKVRIPRGMTEEIIEKIEAEGWLEAVKVAKSLDREVIEKWPEERLETIGVERKRKEKFEYEVRNV